MSNMLAIENATDSATAFAELSRALQKASKKIWRNVGWPNGHGHYMVNWHKKFGFWSLTRTDVGDRFWCAYGTQNPEKHKYLSITCEINPPKARRNQRCAGVFLRDSHGQIYLAHSGKVGGGKTGVGKRAFRKYYRRKPQSFDWLDGKTSSSFIIGRVSSRNFLSQLAEFIRKVDEFKTDTRTTVNRQLAQDAVKAEHGGDFDPMNVKENREKMLRQINLRRGQPEFRSTLIAAYGGQCAISDCNCKERTGGSSYSALRGN